MNSDTARPGNKLEELTALLRLNLGALAEGYPVLDCLDESTGAPSAGWRVMVGLSGGSDSLALLLAARALFGVGAIQAIHVDHGLQATSRSSAQDVVELCRRLGVLCHVVEVSVSRQGNLEQAARESRYQAFADVMADSVSILLLAHHQQDSAETVLMRLLRGRSAVDVPAVRRLANGWLLRPLLTADRQLLDDVVDEAGQVPVIDPSNADERFDRNWLRRSVMPALRSRVPNVDAILSHQGDRHRATQELLADLLKSCSDDDAHALKLPDNATARVLRVGSLQRFGRHAALALRAWLHSVDVHEFSDRQLKELSRQILSGASSGGLHGRQVSLQLWRSRIYLEDNRCWFAENVQLWPATRLQPDAGGVALIHGELSWPPTEGVNARSSDQRPVQQSLQVMPAGAYKQKVMLPGRTGSRGLSQILAGADVPPWRRRGYPVILRAGRLIEVAGLGPAHAVGEEDSGAKFGSIWRPFVVAG